MYIVLQVWLVRLDYDDTLTIVGTAHISRESIEEVKKTIAEVKPDIVAVELDRKRYKVMTERKKWENTRITDLIKGGNAFFLLAQIFLGSIQRRLGSREGVEPGAEMMIAIRCAREQRLRLKLVDRDIGITFKRMWVKMGLRERMRLLWHFIKALVGFDEEEEDMDISQMLKEDVISTLIQELKEIAPSVTKVLIFERDAYIARKLLECKAQGKTVAVVGAGHLNGIRKYLDRPEKIPTYKRLEHVPQKNLGLYKTLSILIPMLILGMFSWLAVRAYYDPSFATVLWSSLFVWFMINGIGSAIGAAIGGGHPVSIATAFVAAPFTSLNPAIAAGWVAGYVEAKVRTPTVKDFESLGTVERFRDFYRNRAVKILMVTAFANLGSAIATYVALGLIIPTII